MQDSCNCFAVYTGSFELRIVLPIIKKSLPLLIASLAFPPCVPIPGE